MGKIVTINLSLGSVESREYNIKEEKHYGRGLAIKLLDSLVPKNCGRLDEKNALIFVPGYFTGSAAPSTSRGLIVAKGEGKKGIAISNVTGDFPQKMASMNIDALIILGKAVNKNAVIHLGKSNIEILTMPELEGENISYIVDKLREKFGTGCAIAGVGKAGDMQIPISSMFMTYPEGQPRFYSPKSGFGDISGSKGLRAIVINHSKYFESPCFDREAFSSLGKKLASIIIDNEICGVALPRLGSSTLLHIMKSNKAMPSIPTKEKFSHKDLNDKKINRCCAPMCVVGCLNRHITYSGDVFVAPEESEVREALEDCFKIEDFEFAKELNKRSYDIGINVTEYIRTLDLFYKVTGHNPSKESILKMMDEIEQGTLTGRLLGGGTEAICNLYKDRADIQKSKTRPSISREQEFTIKLNKFSKEFEGLSDFELLYRQVFLLENLGFCIFTSFAILNNQSALELIADMFYYKSGIRKTVPELLQYAGECINNEMNFQKECHDSEIQKIIPDFIKVLYNYFSTSIA